MEALIRTLLTIVACTDWVTMEVQDPKGGYLSVPRLAELACLPVRLIEPLDDKHRSRHRHDRAERALRVLREAGIIAFTKQHRKLLPDGTYRSTSPALRKLAVGVFRKFGGYLLRIFEKRREKLKRLRERDEPTTGYLRMAAILRGFGNGGQAPSAPSDSGADDEANCSTGSTPQSLLDAIHEEHPTWELAEILAEAHRRRARRAAPS